MKIIKKDITTIESGIIAHQVNCTNHIGSGVAKALIAKYPIIKTSYHEWCSDYRNEDLLGGVQLLSVSEKLYVVNCFSQRDKGYDNKLYTNYEAVENCFKTLYIMNRTAYGAQIYIPFNYGCGLGNGNWETITEIIDKVCPGVIACQI